MRQCGQGRTRAAVRHDYVYRPVIQEQGLRDVALGVRVGRQAAGSARLGDERAGDVQLGSLLDDRRGERIELGMRNADRVRQQLKRDELLPKYQDYVKRYIDSGLNHPNSVLMQVMVWLFDTAQFEEGLVLAGFAMAQGQEMPERFKRDVPTFVADELIEWAEVEHKAGRSPEPYLSDLLTWVDGEWVLFERIPARYHKLIGVLAVEAKDWVKAIQHFERATELYPEIGVGTRLTGARKGLEKEQKEQAGNGSE